METEQNQLISIAEAAHLLGRDSSYLQYYIKVGRFPAHQIIGGRKLFNKDDILNWKPERLKRGRRAVT